MTTQNHYYISKTEKRAFIIMNVLLILFLCFFIFYHITDYSFFQPDKPSCVMKMFFHLYCPGCGGSRALDCFLHGRLIQSFLFQPVIVYLAAYFLSYYIPALMRMTGLYKGKYNPRFYLYPLFGLLALIILFFVIRNLLLVYGGYDYIGECVNYWK